MEIKHVIEDAQVAYLMGHKENAKKLIDSALFKSILDASKNLFSSQYISKIDSINHLYKPIYGKMNFEMPEIDIYKTKENLPL